MTDDTRCPAAGRGSRVPARGQHAEQIVAQRRQPRHLRLDLGDVAAQQAFSGLARARPGVADALLRIIN